MPQVRVLEMEARKGLRTRGLLSLLPLLLGCSAMSAQTATLVVTGSGGTTHDFTGSYYGDHGGTPFTISAAQPSVPPADNFNITGSFASSSATIHIQGNVVFGRTAFNGCPYSFCTWVYGAGATLNISLQGTAGTDYAIDITRTASMSAATADSVAAYSASADSTSVNTQSGPPSASFSTVSTIRGTGSISTTISLGGSVGFRQISCVSDAEGCLGGTTYPGGGAGTVDYTLTIVAHVNNQPPLSLSCPASAGTVNAPYASAFAASGGTGTFTSYAIASGALPPVLSLNSVGGVSGTPTTAGPYSFTGRVTDSSGATATSPTCSITVSRPPCTYSLSYSSRNFPKEGGPGAVDVTASDISCPVYSSSSVSWVIFSGPQPQYGSGTVYYSVASNPGPGRSTDPPVLVANQPLTISQDPGDSCGDQRDQIIQEYRTDLPDFIPQCSDFTQGFTYLNTGDYSWALVRVPLVNGLGSITTSYGAVTVNSAYRNPVRNGNVPGSAGHSRHMYGDAVDIGNSPATLANWQALYQTAQSAGANFIEGQTSRYPCRCTTDRCVCLHADWRSTPGPYEQ